MSNQIVFQRYEKLKTYRDRMKQYWNDIDKYCIPGKNIHTDSIKTAKSKPDVYDSTAFRSSAILSSGLYGQLTNPASRWFTLSGGRGNVSDNEWVYNLERKIYDTFDENGFYTSVSKFYSDLIHYGIACMRENISLQNEFEFVTISPYNFLFAKNSKGQLTDVFVEFELSYNEAVERFGENALSSGSKSKGKSHEKIKFLSWTFYSGDELFPVYESYYEVDTRLAVGLEKYKNMPYFVVNWDERSGMVYSSSPSLTVLPDVKMLNRIMKSVVEGIEINIHPAYSLPYDGYLEPITLEPGGLNYRLTNDPHDSMLPITNVGNIEYGVEMINMVKDKINQGYFVDLFLMLQQNTMTATEVIQRAQEKMLLLGSVVGRLSHDFLTPLIKRTIFLLLAYNIVPQNKNVPFIDIKYISQLAQSQKASEYASIVQLLNTALTIGQYDQSVFDNMNTDMLIRKIGEIYAVEPAMFNSMKDVMAIRKSRAEQQAQQQQLQYGLIESKVKKQEASAQRDYVKSTLGR